jgi:predicted kinase
MRARFIILIKGQPTMAQLYIVCGLPFAGKTTLAKALEQRLGFTRIDLDQINTALGVGLDGSPISPKEWDRTYAESYRQLGVALAAGQSVVYDATNFTKAQRDHLRAIANALNAPARVIYVALSEAEARLRWLSNRATHERYDVRDEDFELVATHFEPPIAEEQVIYYYPSQPLDDWIHTLLRDTSHFNTQGQ